MKIQGGQMRYLKDFTFESVYWIDIFIYCTAWHSNFQERDLQHNIHNIALCSMMNNSGKRFEQ